MVGLDRLLAYRSVRCHAAGSNSSSTIGYVAARSVTTATGATFVVPMARTALGEEFLDVPVGEAEP